MKIKNRVIIALIAITFFGCGLGKLPKEKANYEGIWQCNEVYLKISSDANVEYKKESRGVKTSIKAPINNFEGDNFVVGALGMNTTFVVSKPPHLVNTIWKITVDGFELTKVDEY